MTECVIRKCSISDAQALCDLNTDEMGYDYPVEKTKESLELILSDKNNIVFVAVSDVKVVGYVHGQVYQLIYAPAMINIMGIAVNREFKRKGIGKALMSEIEKYAKENGINKIRLNSGKSRLGAHSFYRKCGYGNIKQQLKFTKDI